MRCPRAKALPIYAHSAVPFKTFLSWAMVSEPHITSWDFLSCSGREEPCLLNHSVSERHLPQAIHHGIHTASNRIEGHVEL